MYLRPRICGLVTYRGEILNDADGNKVRGQWEPILTEEEYSAVVAMWGPSEKAIKSRLGAKGARLSDYLPAFSVRPMREVQRADVRRTQT
jgi:hypothetical protein